MSLSLNDAAIFSNLNGLSAINQLGRQDSDAALRKVAEQFEAIFLNIMLKGMRAGEDALFADNYLNSNEMKFHRENFDNQLALHMASHGGTGLAEVLHRQLSQRFAAETDVAQRQESAATAIGINPLRLIEGTSIRPRPEPVQTMPAVFETPQQFVDQLLPIAQQVAPQLGVDPQVLVAQAALETGWGRKMIRGADGQFSHNLFGIKAGAGWNGESATVSTLEYRNGVMQRESASFRVYSSYEESFRDYARLIRTQPRYAEALAHAGDASAYGRHLQQAGYATDPHYASKIARVLNNQVFNRTDAERIIP
jgi:peptidoglycan hydrolase FlgJ